MTKIRTICAVASPQGIGALGTIRVSGPEAVSIVGQLFSKSDKLIQSKGYELIYGQLKHRGEILDDVLLSVFKSPKSFTGEDTVEISCHGSEHILKRVTEALIELGADQAQAGEFTQRAFLNGKLDLSQAEAVGDLIAAESDAERLAALGQLQGGIKLKIGGLREKLIHFSALVALELDFGEEDVEFANRGHLKELIEDISKEIDTLLSSFASGRAMKEGVRTVIVGPPNAGKSTLLNTFLQEERAIVSAVAGTTRDVIEETILINGIKFRLMDTAGIRDSADEVEQIGIERTMSKINEADLIIYLIPYQNFNSELIEEFILSLPKGKKLIIGVSKVDEINNYFDFNISDNQILNKNPIVYFSSKTGHHIDLLKVDMCNAIGLDYEALKRGHVISHGRHFDALQKAKKSVSAIMETLKMDGISQDFMLVDIQLTLEYIGLITGQVYPDDILGEIFSKFCIGK